MPRNLGWVALIASAAVAGAAALLLRPGAAPPGPPTTEVVRIPQPVRTTAPAVHPPRTETTALEGQALRRGSGDPLAVEVAVLLPDGRTLETAGGADGRFRVEGLPRGVLVDVAVSYRGLATARLARLAVPAEGVLAIPPLRLGAARAVAARVLGADRTPLPGASIRLRSSPWWNTRGPGMQDRDEPWPVVVQAAADPVGRARFPDMSAGLYRVEATAPGLAVAAREVVIREDADPEPLEFVLGFGVALTVEVREAAGLPVAGARVWSEEDAAVVEAVTDADGACRLEGLAPGTPKIAAVLPSGLRLGGGRVAVPAVARHVLTPASTTLHRGRVRNAETGEAIAGAEVLLEWTLDLRYAAAASSRATSGADGTFEVEGPSGSPLVVAATARGYLGGRWSVAKERPMAGTMLLSPDEPYDLPLPPARSIRGTVLAEDGSPVPGAYVQLAQAYPGGFAVGSGTQVGADGSFTLEGARPGPAMVKASAPGWWQPGYPAEPSLLPGRTVEYPPSCSVVVPEKGEVFVDIVLRRGGTVSGVIVDSGGRPLGKKPLSLARQGTDAGGFAVTSEDGSFAIHGVRPGTGFAISVAEGGGHRVASPTFDLPEGGSAEGLRLTVPRGASVHGAVIDSDGRPAVGATVRVLPGSAETHWDYGPRGNVPSAAAGADGTFRVSDLIESPAQVVLVHYPGHEDAAVDLVDLRLSEDRGPVEVRLRAESPLPGIVVDEDGNPVAGARIAAGPGRDPGKVPMRVYRRGPDGTVRALSDASGRFVVGGLAAGWRVLRAEATGFLPETVDVEGGEARIVLLRPRSIGGVVREKGTGAPLAGAEVTAWPEDTSAGGVPGRAVADAAGRFRIEGLRPGRHRISANAAGNWFWPDPFQIDAGTGDVVLEPEKGFVIAGRVLDAEGRPVESGYVHCGPAGKHFVASGQVGSGGAFRLGPLRAGRYRVRAVPPGWRNRGWKSGEPVPAEVADVEAGREDVEIRLVPGATLRGRIVDGTGMAEALDLAVAVIPAGTGKPVEEDVRWVKAERDGYFEIPGLDPRVALDLALRGGKVGIGGFLHGIRAEVGEVTLAVDGGRTIAGRVVDESGGPVSGIRLRAVATDARGVEDGLQAEATSMSPFVPNRCVSPTPAEREESARLALGEFLLKGLGAFRFRIAARTSGTDWAPAAVEEAAGAPAPVEIRLRPGAVIEGRVLGEWERERELGVVAEAVEGDPADSAYSGVREDGTFRLRGLAPGPHRLRFRYGRGPIDWKDAGTVVAPAAGIEIRRE